MKKRTLTTAQLTEWIRNKYPKARGLANAIGITTAGAYRILKGEVVPSPETLGKLGVSVKTIYEVSK